MNAPKMGFRSSKRPLTPPWSATSGLDFGVIGEALFASQTQPPIGYARSNLMKEKPPCCKVSFNMITAGIYKALITENQFRLGMLLEQKIRLGSTPPSCHNRCNECNPCTAVQLPTLPFQPNPVSPSRVREAHQMDDPSSYSNQYSNYKPLGWKCSCGDHLYSP
ncbi:unnamed protein product [Musa hybrid cultivar]